MNNFDVLKEMCRRNLNCQLAPIGNIERAQVVKAGTQITIGVAGNRCSEILTGSLVGGLILADKAEFDSVKSEMSKASTIRTRADIEAEIEALAPVAKDYDTEAQSNDTCVAAGAHDALRWALGLAESSVSEGLKQS